MGDAILPKHGLHVSRSGGEVWVLGMDILKTVTEGKTYTTLSKTVLESELRRLLASSH